LFIALDLGQAQRGDQDNTRTLVLKKKLNILLERKKNLTKKESLELEYVFFF